MRTRNLCFVMLLLFTGAISEIYSQAPLQVPGNEYAFQFIGDPDVGLYFNQTEGAYQFTNLTGTPQFSLRALNGNTYFLGNVGIGITNPAVKLQVIGSSRFGDASNRAQIDATGNLRFFGTAAYNVGNNQYAFKYSGGSNGLFFNTSDFRYDFLNNVGDRVFSVSVDAAGDGNMWMQGDALVNGNGSSEYSIDAVHPDVKKAAVYGHNTLGTDTYSQGYLGALPGSFSEYLPYKPTNASVLGVKGKAGSNGVSVYGYNQHGSGDNYAGFFQATGASSGTNYGIYAKADSAATNYAGYFDGDVTIDGNLNVTGTLTDNAWAYSTGSGLSGDIYHEGDVALGTFSDPDGHGLNVQNYSNGKGAVRGVDQSGSTLYAEGILGVLSPDISYTLPVSLTNIGVLGYKPDAGSNGAGVVGLNEQGSSSNYGGVFSATGSGTNNYGLWATAANGTNNYAGYFQGDVFVSQTLKFNTSGNNIYSTGANLKLESSANLILDPGPAGYDIWIQNGAGARLATFEGGDDNVLIGTTTNDATRKLKVVTDDKANAVYSENSSSNGSASALKGEITNPSYSFTARGVEGIADLNSFDGYGGFFSGGWYGVRADATTAGTNTRYGVYGNAGGTTGTSYGVFGAANGTGTNYAVYASGTLAYTGALLNVSDSRFKNNVEKIEDATDLLLKLTPRTYEYKTDEYNFMHLAEGKQYGFIAQELEQVMPELVQEMKNPGSEDPEYRGEELSFKGVSYVPLIPVLVQAFNEQNARVDELAESADPQKIAALEEEVSGLRAELDELKDMVRSLDASLAQCCVSHESDKAFENTDKASLGQNIPNPFTNSTLISYYLPFGTQGATLIVMDMKGSKVREFNLNGEGFGQVEFSNSQIGAGTYLYTLTIGGRVIDTRQMVLVR